jgi:AmmeMemoRadiSam system protein A
MPETSPLVELARKTIEQYVTSGTVPQPPDPLPEEMAGRAGVFVSVHLKNGDLRGCIGTFEPVMPNIAQEIIQNAVSAATQDPRFPPIGADELGDLDISVDVLSAPEPCYSLEELDPKQYGVIVQCRGRRGLLLPDLEGVDTPEQQVGIAMRKAGIRPSESIALQRFTVKRYHCVE